MPENDSKQSDKPDGIERFFGALENHLKDGSLVKLVLGKRRCGDPDLTSVIVRPVVVKGGEMLSFVYRYRTKDVTKNLSAPDGAQAIRSLLGGEFKSAHLFSTAEDVQLEFSKKGKCVIGVGKATRAAAPSKEHNREKRRAIDTDRPFLAALGVTSEAHQVLPSMSRKWKQINVFLDLFRQAFLASPAASSNPASVVDFGSGKGYLTFAVHDWLVNGLGIEARVTGVEIRGELVSQCDAIARRLGLVGLSFAQGDVGSYAPGSLDVMIALHACDTATDQAITMGVRAGASVIMCAPCCHKELRPRIVIPPVMRPVLRFGIHLGQEAEMVTDSLRALSLEASGYEVQLFEFISLEHTAKNKMLLAIRRGFPEDRRAAARAQADELKRFYGVKEFRLESLLADHPPP